MGFDISDVIFRAAKKEDIEELHLIARRIVATGFNHWDDEYPTRTTFTEDLERGELYVAEYLGKPVAMICMIFSIDQIKSLQENPDTNFSPAKKPAMLCRLGVEPKYEGHGIASVLMAGCEDMAKKLGGDLLELLVAADNPSALHIYRDKFNYVYRGRGIVYGEDYLAYEKRI